MFSVCARYGEETSSTGESVIRWYMAVKRVPVLVCRTDPFSIVVSHSMDVGRRDASKGI